LKIAFFGSSLVSAYWNGAATYYRGMIRALNHLGHQVTFYEPDAYDRQKHRDIPDPPWARVVIYPVRCEADALQAVESAHHADLLVKASGVGVFDELLERAVLEMKGADSLTVFWDVDAPATLDRLQRSPDDPFLPLVSRYDLILTYGGGDPVVKGYQSFGARQCHPIYNALDPDTHYPVPPDSAFAADLGFLGNHLPDRAERAQEFFFQAAQELGERQFLLGGNGWDSISMPKNVRYVGHVYTSQHNAFNCTPLAVLNVNRESMARYGFSPPTRVFEAAGAGACLISDYWAGIEAFLESEREALLAHNGHEVSEHLRGLAPERARAIGQAARRRILAEHTYIHRAAQLETILGVKRRPAQQRIAP
jgi:spore maturation protein CgeB